MPSSVSNITFTTNVSSGNTSYWVRLSSSELPTINYDGKKFLGWYFDQSFTMKATPEENTNITSVYNGNYEVHVYARWQETVYFVSEKTLTGLADAIRTHSGDANKLSLSEMTDVITNGFGGGAVAGGSFTMSADSNKYVVTHGIGTVPKIIACWVKDYETSAGYFTLGIGALDIDGITYVNVPVYAKTASTSGQYAYPGESKKGDFTENLSGNLNSQGAFYDANADTFSIGDNTSGTTCIVKLHAGKTYYWVVAG